MHLNCSVALAAFVHLEVHVIGPSFAVFYQGLHWIFWAPCCTCFESVFVHKLHFASAESSIPSCSALALEGRGNLILCEVCSYSNDYHRFGMNYWTATTPFLNLSTSLLVWWRQGWSRVLKHLCHICSSFLWCLLMTVPNLLQFHK